MYILFQVLRQTMEMMRNPDAMREAMRGQDLAMSQIENLPGGFNALRRVFEDVQEPLMEASMGAQQPTQSNTTSSSSTASTGALPNPWGAAANFNNSNAAGGAGFGNPFGGGKWRACLSIRGFCLCT
jgi:ubiquilin